MASPRKVCFFTLGCKLNYSESSTIARQFEEGGFIRVSGSKEADLCVINTCSVTEHADKKCRNLIRRLHRENPNARIVVTGCYAQLKPDEVAAMEGVDLVVGNNSKEDLYIQAIALPDKGPTKIIHCGTDEITRFFAAFSTGDRTRAFLKVQDGCDYKCAYCTIHNARGASRNISIASLMEEARRIAATGRKEIVLTGINTGDFGKTTGESFLTLLQRLHEVDGIERYRISSIEPNLLTDEVIDFCAASSKFQPHYHIPLQSGSDRILARMGRRYTASVFADRIESIRRRMPDAFIGIDVIVGFPGESDENFAETYDLLERLHPAYLHVFPFSERNGTPAATFPNKVKDCIKTLRAESLNTLCRKLHTSFYEDHDGKTALVLFENAVKGGFMGGFTENYIRVKTPYDRARINSICRVELHKGNNPGEMLATIQD